MTPATLLVFLSSLTFTSLLIAVILLAYRRAAPDALGMDPPHPRRKHHPRAVPRLAGIALFGSFSGLHALSEGVSGIPTIALGFPIWLGVTLIFLLGLVDDYRSLGPWVKLTGQLAVALLAWLLGLRIECGNDAGSLAFTLLWLVAIPNALNLADGMDGLAGGIGLVLCLAIGLVAPETGAGLLCFGMAGAMLGFLAFNRPPARIFLGDGGAYLVGFFLAAIAIALPTPNSQGRTLLLVLIALGVPILDAVLSFLRRWIKGVPVMRGDADHVHHRLLARSGSTVKALSLYYTGLALSAGLGFLATQHEAFPIWTALIFQIGLSALILKPLGYVREWRTAGSDLIRTLRARREVQFATLVSEALEREVERHEESGEFWAVFASEMSRVSLSPLPSASSLPLTISIPFGRLKAWTVYSTQPVSDFAPIESVAQCLVSPLRLGVRKFGRPDWDGLS